jgi:transposase
VKSSRPVEPAYFDLKGLSAYTGGGLSIRTLRKVLTMPDGLPHFRVGGKILVSKNDFDSWVKRYRKEPLDLDAVVEEVLKDL